MTDQPARRPQIIAETPQCRPTDDAASPTQKTYQFDDLSEGSAEVLIVHGDDCYRLRRTRNGKLLLNK